jgi:hypothetical protein
MIKTSIMLAIATAFLAAGTIKIIIGLFSEKDADMNKIDCAVFLIGFGILFLIFT